MKICGMNVNMKTVEKALRDEASPDNTPVLSISEIESILEQGEVSKQNFDVLYDRVIELAFEEEKRTGIYQDRKSQYGKAKIALRNFDEI